MITKRSVVTVVGVADRLALPKKILRFCGTFPIYEVEIDEIPSDGLNTTLRQDSGKLVFYIFLVVSNARPVLSQCNTRLSLLYLLNK